MSELYLKEGTALDHKLTRLFFSSQTYTWYKDEWELSEFYEFSHWTRYIESLPHVKSAQFVASKPGKEYTLITFDSEEHKTWFILRYS